MQQFRTYRESLCLKFLSKFNKNTLLQNVTFLLIQPTYFFLIKSIFYCKLKFLFIPTPKILKMKTINVCHFFRWKIWNFHFQSWNFDVTFERYFIDCENRANKQTKRLRRTVEHFIRAEYLHVEAYSHYMPYRSKPPHPPILHL